MDAASERVELASLMTDHEWRVASAVGRGATNKAVARDLSISIKTVEYHLGNIYRRLSISSRAELAHAIGRQSGRGLEPGGRLGNLSGGRLPLIGRESLLAELANRVKASSLVTLTGAGGVGKTSVAREVADQLASGFRDGAWLVEFAALQSGGDVTTAAAIALGLSERLSAPTPADIAAQLRGQQRIVVLDNCEHVLDHAAQLAAAIAGSCPDVVVLATSRERLDVSAEQVIAVPPLEVEVIGDVSPAVRLFVERARAAYREFEVSDREWAILDSLCRRLDGLPLAIELAAARVAGLSIADIHDRVDDRFALLSRRRETTGTHHSLYQTIGWSYDLLSDDEQRVFASLSVFAGDFDARAAAAVGAFDGGTGDVTAHLASLVEKSMVVVTSRDGVRRYRLLDTLRDYARGRLIDRDGQTTAARRHLDHFRRFAHEIDQALQGPDELAAHRSIVADWHNIRTAMATACTTDEAVEACGLLDDTFWWARTRLRSEIGEWAERVRHLPSAVSLPMRTVATTICASQAVTRGDTEVAEHLINVARVEEERFGPLDKPWIPVIAVDIGDPKQRWAATQDTQARGQRAGNLFWEVVGLLQETAYLGIVVARVPLPAEDIQRYTARIRHGMDMAERLGCPNGMAFAAMTLGTALAFSDAAQARSLLERSLTIAAPLGLELLAFQARRGLAIAHASSGQPADALRVIADSLSAHLRNGNSAEFAEDLATSVGPLVDIGEHDLATVIVNVINRAVQAGETVLPIAFAYPEAAATLSAATIEGTAQRSKALTLVDVVSEFVATVNRRVVADDPSAATSAPTPPR
ncbi:MAG: LuxR C-terminal-related transcriptional regulator [Ilumatobacteraceae bacterium]